MYHIIIIIDWLDTTVKKDESLSFSQIKDFDVSLQVIMKCTMSNYITENL